MNKIFLLVVFLTVIILPLHSFAEDGTYDATVTTDSGTYAVPVEVEDGEVTQVHWPNGGDMSASGADIVDGQASGVNSNGDSVDIEVDDYGKEEED